MNKLGIRINAKLELICMYHKKIPDATYQATCQSVMRSILICELIFHFQNDTINYDEFRTHAIYNYWEWNPQSGGNEEEKFAAIYQLSS
jgi:hypothetical protein